MFETKKKKMVWSYSDILLIILYLIFIFLKIEIEKSELLKVNNFTLNLEIGMNIEM